MGHRVNLAHEVTTSLSALGTSMLHTNKKVDEENESQGELQSGGTTENPWWAGLQG
jgi:hypothetical protein